MDEFKIPTVTKKPPPLNTKYSQQNDNSSTYSTINENRDEIHNPQINCSYIEPEWSGHPNSDNEYKFEVLKSGTIAEVVNNLESKPYWLFGRLPDNDIVMAHPTISRYHAVLQYRPAQLTPTENENNNTNTTEEKFSEGWYIFDLGSTHGTFLNKQRIPAKTFIPVRVGHMIKLGGSTRNYILQGPEFDEEPESELTVTEMKELRHKQEEEKRAQEELQESMREKEGISWGMSEDADEESDLTINPYASTNNEELFLDDPKKTLRGFFEREGLELDYKVDEMSAGTFVCKVELPIDDANGKPIIAEVCHKGKKKECVLQCALESCRILDRHGVLRQATHEPMKRRARCQDSDDEDDFLDRTGDVERKKLKRAAAYRNHALTYDDLINHEADHLKKISDVENNILKYQEMIKRSKNQSNEQEEDLDHYMQNLSQNDKLDKTEIRKLRVELQRLNAEHQTIQRLIKIAMPTQLPSIKQQAEKSSTDNKKAMLPLFGKRSKLKVNIPKTAHKTVEHDLKSDEEEMEEVEPIKPEDVIEPSTNEQELKERVSSPEVQDDDSKRKILGPALIPPEISENINTKDSDNTKHSEITEKNTETPRPETKTEKSEDEILEAQDGNSLAKKRRNRNRYRAKCRENVDIDDAEEIKDAAKYSGWVPPQNQSGDGITSLNQKFGY